ncbi:cytochrome c4 [Permianibacter aggregans]|uniref:Cytochrome c553 n=2 Tax=Permianibacter aggregans TaxID=1510150 RepID=A0A4V3D728_9GAMM|nr:c-type cytochrome [Permianibacter aggregans]QGX41756.1 cytochrome c4 [Permianibacter aggregans]TDQ46267.1 cytochrome c553 [Permianibacter aggregans]
MKKLLVLAAVLLAGNGAVLAGDAAAGKSKAATCAACHGPDGNSVNAMWPKLAGQHESYLLKQLKEFKKGMETQGKVGRFEPSMSPMAAPLSEADMADLAAYYASQSIQYAGVKPQYVELGGKLYRGGDVKTGVPACTACHGPDGKGMPSAKFPALGGQHVDYTIAQLKAFRDGKRQNDPNGMMRGAAKNLTDAQIEALAHYLVGLH